MIITIAVGLLFPAYSCRHCLSLNMPITLPDFADIIDATPLLFMRASNLSMGCREIYAFASRRRKFMRRAAIGTALPRR